MAQPTTSSQPAVQGRRLGMKRNQQIANIAAFMVLLILAAFAMLPIWWIFRTSLMTNPEAQQYPPAFFPSRWLFSNYAKTLETYDFPLYLKNSMMIIVPSVIFGTVTATMCGYALARLRFRGKKLVFTLCVGSMLLPSMVTLIPLYIMWTKVFGLTDSYLPLILPYLCGGGAFNIFLIRQFIGSIPKELDEAAKIDGAGSLRILVSILLPSIRSAIIVVGLFLFITIWNDLLQQTVYIQSEQKQTIAIAITKFTSATNNDYSKTMCATCMSFLPGIIIYLFGQRYFVEGIVMTGMKS